MVFPCYTVTAIQRHFRCELGVWPSRNTSWSQRTRINFNWQERTNYGPPDRFRNSTSVDRKLMGKTGKSMSPDQVTYSNHVMHTSHEEISVLLTLSLPVLGSQIVVALELQYLNALSCFPSGDNNKSFDSMKYC